ncbi:efflux (PET) family inner membrane protein YccS [Klebsiella pneumoniae]|uniref:Efflux (PET) family inner membrane protein YccS n=1 Tax=Klebsiella pneumoniae TaxID=573 RepID=A0A378BFP2_KLEPN|nr:efflux (PET) family inner membrane protein YccS [Klebsiella pneumoniae]
MNANCRYLDAILEQYHQGRDNRLAYRVARRDAYNRDAELASVVSNLSTEPRADATQRELPFVCYASTTRSPATSPLLARIGKNCPRRKSSPCWMMQSVMWMTPCTIPPRMNSGCNRL